MTVKEAIKSLTGRDPGAFIVDAHGTALVGFDENREDQNIVVDFGTEGGCVSCGGDIDDDAPMCIACQKKYLGMHKGASD